MRTHTSTLLCQAAVLLSASCLWSCESQSESSTPQIHSEVDQLDGPGNVDGMTSDTPHVITLLTALSTPGLRVSLRGVGDSMTLYGGIRNDTEEYWEIEIESGTKFEPSDENTQSMVATEELEVSVDKHETHEFSVQVACLDISKDAPSPSDQRWTISESSQLKAFIGCVNECLDEASRGAEEGTESLDDLRTFFVQCGLWQARGATHEDWIEFFTKYWRLTRDEAEETIALLQPILDELTTRCPEL